MDTFILIGRSGCGKGTQGKLLEAYLQKKSPDTSVFYLETGQAFRNFLSIPGYSSLLAKEVNAEGGLQPEFLAVWAWAHLLIENFKGNEHLIIDGTPRKLREAAVLDSAMKFYKRERPHVLFINVSREWSREKLLARKRSDDETVQIERRLNWFEGEVLPALSFFKDNPEYRFRKINGEQTVEEVNAEILVAIGATE